MAGTCKSNDKPSSSLKWGYLSICWGRIGFSTRILLHGVSQLYIIYGCDRGSHNATWRATGWKPPVQQNPVQIVSQLWDYWDVTLTTHLHRKPRLRMCGTMPLLPLFTFLACTAATLPFLTQHLLISHLLYTYNYTCNACTRGPVTLTSAVFTFWIHISLTSL